MKPEEKFYALCDILVVPSLHLYVTENEKAGA
jgi:hypothetical protein